MATLDEYAVHPNMVSGSQQENLQEVQRFMALMAETNHHIRLKEAMNRNIIFVGKTRSGKSTALNVLKNPFKFINMTSLFSDTVHAAINHFTVEFDVGDGPTNFNINIIDTPGLFEVRDEGESRDNDALEDIVLKCMNSEITKINSIFFVVAYGGQGINPQDIDALEAFIRLFDGAQSHVHVLLTKCEKLNGEDKRKIEDEFRKYPKMKNLLELINPKMYFIGAVEKADYEKGFIDNFREALPNVLNMRQELFFDIVNKEGSFELNTLKLVDKIRDRAKKLYDVLKQQVDKKLIQDLSTFKANCKKLGGWRNLMDQTNVDLANNLLLRCEEYLNGLESDY